MIIEDVAQYIQDSGLGTINTDIFIGELQAEKNDCVSLVYQISPEPYKTIDVYEQDIEFWSKNKNSQQAYEKLLSIMNLIHQGQNYKLGDYHIYYSYCIGTINDQDRDTNRNKMYSMTLRFIYRLDALVS
jgi:hypothetical protein